ncbi:MAG TPA: class I SAM-dependent methyltransferase [Pyrinomonadaceae bacterium]|nr:class I SAM-dependent methyltransferase [Pyrinomonadaceae bacterium]
MDEIAAYNQARWKQLADADALFTRPRFDLDPISARQLVDPDRRLGELDGKSVLCLAGGGGRQSAAYALLGADVTVVDLSAEQLERDVNVAEHYRVPIKTVQADMRSLSGLEPNSFDVVDHAYSINFVPDCVGVFHQVARVLRPPGLYRMMCANPFTVGMGPGDWNGTGYSIRQPYVQGARLTYEDQEWVYDRALNAPISKPVEFRHTLSSVVNGLAAERFSILHLWDSQDMYPDLDAEPGSWDHFVAFAPPWLSFLARLEH